MQRTSKGGIGQTIALGAAILLFSGCVGGQGPFLQVQLCVASPGGVDHLKAELETIARNEHVRYIDGSRQTTRDLKLLSPKPQNFHTDGRLVNVGIEADGYGLMAGNLGLNPYQIAVGFGPDTPEARLFADRVVKRLAQRWPVTRVPSGSGVLPDPTCADKPATPPNNSSKPTPLRGAA
ncbi:hypothetical protein ACVWZN_001570 [Lysobacter sp. HA35]